MAWIWLVRLEFEPDLRPCAPARGGGKRNYGALVRIVKRAQARTELCLARVPPIADDLRPFSGSSPVSLTPTTCPTAGRINSIHQRSRACHFHRLVHLSNLQGHVHACRLGYLQFKARGVSPS